MVFTGTAAGVFLPRVAGVVDRGYQSNNLSRIAAGGFGHQRH